MFKEYKNDKELQRDKAIEEMAKVIEEAMAKARRTLGGHNNIAMFYATMLVNAGYRKIPENSVVLTGTETEEHIEDLLIDFDEMSFYPATTCPNPEEYAREWKRKLIYAIGQLRKETAEKFAEMLKELVADRNCNEDYEWEDVQVDGQIFIECVDETCKEITEGK